MDGTTAQMSLDIPVTDTWLTDRARELGFDACGVSPASPTERSDYLREWLSEGKAGEMGWLERRMEERLDPQKVLHGVKSIVVVALNYHQQRDASDARVAQYALGLDYHDWMEPALLQLSKELLARYGGETRHYVDTGPVLERDFAAKAGIGWQGKSTMLISQELGTWFFLGVILTTADLPKSVPMRDHCGKCTRCIDACPTGAITAPYQLDARRCIAYLTIEHKGAIPLEYRRAVGDRFFGCDDCLEACPWNRFAQTTRLAHLAARPLPPVRALLALDVGGFNTLFRGTPLSRLKLSRLKRNACVVLGNVGTEADLPALMSAANPGDPLVEEHARWAMEEIQRRRDSHLPHESIRDLQ